MSIMDGQYWEKEHAAPVVRTLTCLRDGRPCQCTRDASRRQNCYTSNARHIANAEKPDLSVAIKADGDKVRTDLLPVGPMLAIAEVLTFGAKKYEDHNWRKGFKWSRLLGAAMRHLFAFLRGEDKDPETGLSHLAHLGCCVMFLLEHEQRGLGEDDRYKS